MKKLLFGLAVAAIAISCIPSSVIRGSGREGRGTFDISLNYTSLSVSSGIVVELVDSDTGTGFITADEAVLDYVSIVEEDGRVEVSYGPHITVNSDIETVVTMPVSGALRNLDASSAGKIIGPAKLVCSSLRVDCSSAANIDLTVETGEFSASVSSAGKFTGNISARNLTLELTSASGCDVEGSADYCNVDVSSAAHFRGFGLVCRRADIDASSAGSIEISATEELNARASSGGTIRYQGAPRILRRDTSSGGAIREVE